MIFLPDIFPLNFSNDVINFSLISFLFPALFSPQLSPFPSIIFLSKKFKIIIFYEDYLMVPSSIIFSYILSICACLALTELLATSWYEMYTSKNVLDFFSSSLFKKQPYSFET